MISAKRSFCEARICCECNAAYRCMVHSKLWEALRQQVFPLNLKGSFDDLLHARDENKQYCLNKKYDARHWPELRLQKYHHWHVNSWVTMLLNVPEHFAMPLTKWSAPHSSVYHGVFLWSLMQCKNNGFTNKAQCCCVINTLDKFEEWTFTSSVHLIFR